MLENVGERECWRKMERENVRECWRENGRECWIDGVRLRVVAYIAQCVRVVCSVSDLFVCTLFMRPGRCTKSNRTGLCQHAFPRGETSVHFTPDVQDTHSPNSMCAVPGSRATCSPLDCREPRQRQQGVSILASQTSWHGLAPISADARGGPHHSCGLYSTEARDSETHPKRHGSPVQMPPRLKTLVSPSSNPMDVEGRVSSTHVTDRLKTHVSSTHVRDRG